MINIAPFLTAIIAIAVGIGCQGRIAKLIETDFKKYYENGTAKAAIADLRLRPESIRARFVIDSDLFLSFVGAFTFIASAALLSAGGAVTNVLVLSIMTGVTLAYLLVCHQYHRVRRKRPHFYENESFMGRRLSWLSILSILLNLLGIMAVCLCGP